MQVEDFDVYDESCGISIESNCPEGTDLLDNSDEDSMDIVESSLATCSSESSINNENIDIKMNIKPGFVHPKEEMDPLESQANENLRSIFLDTSDGPTCGKCPFFYVLQGVLLLLFQLKSEILVLDF